MDTSEDTRNLHDQLISQREQLKDTQRFTNILCHGFEHLADDNSAYVVSSLKAIEKYLGGIYDSMSESLEIVEKMLER